MRHWPTSLPEYRWPARYGSSVMAPLRWTMAAVFHVAYALGILYRIVADRFARLGPERPTLVIRTDGIGDALLFEPALECLARHVSPSEVHLWAPRATCQLFAECPSITRRVSVPRGGKHGNLTYFTSVIWRAKLGFELGRWIFEKVVHPSDSPEPLGNWLFASARAYNRWMNFGDTRNQFDWQQARTVGRATRVFERRPGNAHELLRNEYVADQWSEEIRLRAPRVHLSERAGVRAGQELGSWRRAARRANAGELAGLVVAGTSRVNHYPAQQWATALRRLWDEQRVMPVLLGGPRDAAALDSVARQLRRTRVPHVRMLKPADVLTTAAAIRGLDGMLSVDTGLAHVALAQRVPAVILTGGGMPGRFFPWPGNREQVVLNVAMPCEGCDNRCHLPEALCVTRISPDDIADAYLALRGRNAAAERFVARRVELPQRAVG